MSHEDEMKNDAEYAHAYIDELQDQMIAAQIRVIREQRGWSQEELGERAGMAQARISLLESGDYSAFTVATLRKLARAFDVGLNVCFAPFFRTVHALERRDVQLLQVSSRTKELQEVAATGRAFTSWITPPAAQDNAIQNRATCARSSSEPVI